MASSTTSPGSLWAYVKQTVADNVPREVTSRLVGQVVVGVAVTWVVSFGALCIYAQKAVLRQQKRLPNSAELEKIGGKFFKRDDGKRLEYFIVNPAPGRPAIVLFHGSSGTGWGMANWRRKEILPLLQRYNVQLICPSMPGHGASEPMRHEYALMTLKDYSSDLTSLLNSLDVSEVFCFGVSYGVEPAFYLAETLLRRTQSIQANRTSSKFKDRTSHFDLHSTEDRIIRVRGVASVCGSPWNTSRFDGMLGGTWLTGMIGKLVMSPFVANSVAYFILDPMLKAARARHEYVGSSPDQIRHLLEMFGASREYVELEKDVIATINYDIIRSAEYFLDALTMPTKYFGQRVETLNTDYSYFNNFMDVPVHFHYGDNDTEVPMPARQYMINSINHSRYFQYSGIHMQLPIKKAIQTMLERAQSSRKLET